MLTLVRMPLSSIIELRYGSCEQPNRPASEGALRRILDVGRGFREQVSGE